VIKILIADDEKLIRKGIIEILNRDLSREVICLEAEDGVRAMKIVEQENPDLVITDISMPLSDGLDFIRHLKDEKYSTEVFILTGYEYFEYAKSAMKMGIKDYIMKPIKKQELLELVDDYIQEIEKGRMETEETVRKTIWTKNFLKQVKNETLLSLLHCRNQLEAEKYFDRLKELGIYFQSNLFVCAMIQYEITVQNREYMDFAAQNIVEEYFSVKEKAYSFVTVEYEPGKMVILFEGINQPAFWEAKKAGLQECNELIRKFGKSRTYAGLGDVAFDRGYLNHSLKQAIKTANFKIYGGKERLSVYSELVKGGERKSEGIDAGKLLKEADGNIPHILNVFEKLIREPKSIHALEKIEKLFEDIKGLAWRRQIQMKDFSWLFDFTELKKEIKYGVNALWEIERREGKEYRNEKLIEDILYYIGSNLAEELDLNKVAEKFSRTTGYISALFRKSTGLGFNEYITSERIKVAQELLADPAISVRAVAKTCGYQNSKYFSVVFKRITNKTPRQFRKENR